MMWIHLRFNNRAVKVIGWVNKDRYDEVGDNEYLKFSCENKGKCCNIYHMKKYTYSNKNDSSKLKNCGENNDKNKSKNNDLGEPVQINVDKKKLIVEI